MDKMIVTVFNDEPSAYEGLKALKELNAEGSLTLYAAAVIAKDAKGLVTLKQPPDRDLVGTAVGLATGSLIGLLGGPVGLVVGAAAGAVGGSIYDLAQVGVNNDFLLEVYQSLAPGWFAVVAEADEEWVTPLDSRMECLGGTVFRRVRAEFVDAQIEQEIAAADAELAQLNAEYNQAVGDAKARLKTKVEAVQHRVQAQRDQLHEKIETIKREGDARIKLLQEQAAKAKAERKAKLEKRVAEERAKQKARSEKLSQAWHLIKEAAAI